jgi:hypothetical protein
VFGPAARDGPAGRPAEGKWREPSPRTQPDRRPKTALLLVRSMWQGQDSNLCRQCRRDQHKQPADSPCRYPASPSVPPRPARSSVGRSESGAKSGRRPARIRTDCSGATKGFKSTEDWTTGPEFTTPVAVWSLVEHSHRPPATGRHPAASSTARRLWLGGFAADIEGHGRGCRGDARQGRVHRPCPLREASRPCRWRSDWRWPTRPAAQPGGRIPPRRGARLQQPATIAGAKHADLHLGAPQREAASTENTWPPA